MTDSLAGYFARFDGEEYPCSLRTIVTFTEVRLYRDTPADGWTEVAPGRHARSVAMADCEVVGYRDEVGTWNGNDALVLSDDVDTVTIEYPDGDGPKALELGYDEVERGVFRVTVPAQEVRDRHRRITLLSTAGLDEAAERSASLES